MKTIKYLLILVLATSMLTACKKDDDGGSSAFLLSKENLAGIYLMAYYQSTLEETFIINGVPINSTTDVVGDTFQGEWSFDSNNSFDIDAQYRIVSTTVVGQEEPLINTEILVINSNGSYNLDANAQTLRLSAEGFPTARYEITLFNETEVRLMLEETETDQDGNVISFTEEIRFVRQ